MKIDVRCCCGAISVGQIQQALVSHLCPSVRRLAYSAWAQLESLPYIRFMCLPCTNRLEDVLGLKVVTMNEMSWYNTAGIRMEGNGAGRAALRSNIVSFYDYRTSAIKLPGD